MNRIIIYCSVALFFACASPKKETKEAPATEPQWVSLFDGQTLNGFKTFKDTEQNCWDVQDGALHCKSAKYADKRADMMTVAQFENFELEFEWKISAGGNSGVMYRVVEDFDAPYLSGPEYQVIDDTGYKGDLSEMQKAGANYDMHVAENKQLKPIGEWNQAKILVNGSHVEHWLNGAKVVEYELWSTDWNDRKAKSKWQSVPGYGMSKRGAIDFQDHGDEVWYRNIRVREL